MPLSIVITRVCAIPLGAKLGERLVQKKKKICALGARTYIEPVAAARVAFYLHFTALLHNLWTRFNTRIPQRIHTSHTLKEESFSTFYKRLSVRTKRVRFRLATFESSLYSLERGILKKHL